MSISMNPLDWNFKGIYVKASQQHPIIDGTGWKFSFSPKHIEYINTRKFDRLKLGQTLTMTFQVVQSPDVVFEYGFGPGNMGLRPANVRFYIQYGLSLSNFANTRWWSNPVSCDLVEAGDKVTLSVGLNPGEWSNIWGHMGNEDAKTIKGFNLALAKAGKIGITFGGGSFFGHGVWLSQGSATFKMKEYKIGG